MILDQTRSSPGFPRSRRDRASRASEHGAAAYGLGLTTWEPPGLRRSGVKHAVRQRMNHEARRPAARRPGRPRTRPHRRTRRAGQHGEQVDITAPPALAPVRRRRDRRRTGPVLAVTATGREADDLADALGCLHAARQRRGLPVLGDAAARAPVAAVRHGRSPAGGAAPAGPPGAGGPLRVVDRSGAGGAPAAAQGPRRPRADRAGAPAGPHDLDGDRPAPGRRRLRPRRPGHQARRVRGARRHPRRLPAHRGAPAAGGVLGRRGRGDPHVRRRRPAHHREGRPACSRRRAGSCCSPTRCGPRPTSSPPSTRSWPRCSTASPPASRSRAWRASRRRCSTGPTRWNC